MRNTVLYPDSIIGSNVTIGSEVVVGHGLFVLDGASICEENLAERHSSDARTIGPYVSIGRGVRLHSEAEIATGAIVPAQETIRSEQFGQKGRILTFYGSENGTRVSLGCRMGWPLARLISKISDEGSASSQSYEPHFDDFGRIASEVQTAYMDYQAAVSEIREARTEHGLAIVQPSELSPDKMKMYRIRN